MIALRSGIRRNSCSRETRRRGMTPNWILLSLQRMKACTWRFTPSNRVGHASPTLIQMNAATGRTTNRQPDAYEAAAIRYHSR